MSENLFKLYVTQFSTLLNLKLQQTQSKLRGRCMEGSHYGKQASPIQYIGAIQMKAPAGRFTPLERQDVDFTRRWVFPVDKEAQQLIDRFDELKLLQDPQSQYVAVAAAAVAREWDDRLIGAAFATAQIGADAGGLSAEVFNTGSTVTSAGFQIPSTFGSSAASGLTVAKMIEAKRAMRKLQVPVDDEMLVWVTNSQGESDLLNQVQVVSTDFTGADRPTLIEGKVTRFMGWDIIYSERLISTSSVRQDIAVVKSGWYLGIWKDTENSIDRRIDLSSLPYQLWTGMSSGATRLEPGRLLQVLCADSSAAADVTP
jgi:capsid protein